jgi:hypothetical protein
MRSPKDMRVIQIEITNACVHQCSNCTRFCGHHKNNYFMEWETFQKSVDSLEEFENCIGIMGGEPTLHPQFERFARYLFYKRRPKHVVRCSRKPVINFPQYIRDKNYFVDECLNNRRGIGLWTSVTKQYYRYFELIQDTFTYQSINDHNNPSIHQPLLASRKEMGIGDDEWIRIRDNCFIQNMWSASITPKGAFFCEVAAALDILFDGPGGWPIEKGWWKREPKDFGYQLNWCEICGGALFHSGRLSSEEIDDVSPMLYDMLKSIDSPKLKAGRIVIMDMDNPQPGLPMTNTRNRYMTDYNERVSRDNRVLFAGSMNIIVHCKTYGIIKDKLDKILQKFEKAIIFADDRKVYKAIEQAAAGLGKVIVIPPQLDDFGRTLSKAVKAAGNSWVCITDDCEIPEESIERIKKVVLNPGVLYSFAPSENTRLFHTYAMALKNAGYEGLYKCNSLSGFFEIWEYDKRITLDGDFDVLKNPDLDEWQGIADRLDEKSKTAAQKVLDKIKSDYMV